MLAAIQHIDRHSIEEFLYAEARCLDEKVTDSASSVDIGMILGTGFPPFRGGLLRWADSVGVGAILKELERFQKEADPRRFEPAPYLRQLVAQGRPLHFDRS